MNLRFNPALGIATVEPQHEQRTNWIIAQRVDGILDKFQSHEIGHDPAVRELIDAGVSLSRISTLLSNPLARRRTS
jgi:hypothetical protein